MNPRRAPQNACGVLCLVARWAHLWSGLVESFTFEGFISSSSPPPPSQKCVCGICYLRFSLLHLCRSEPSSWMSEKRWLVVQGFQMTASSFFILRILYSHSSQTWQPLFGCPVTILATEVQVYGMNCNAKVSQQLHLLLLCHCHVHSIPGGHVC